MKLKNPIPSTPKRLLELMSSWIDIAECEGTTSHDDEINNPYINLFVKKFQRDFSVDDYNSGCTSFRSDVEYLDRVMNRAAYYYNDDDTHYEGFNYSDLTSFKIGEWNSKKFFDEASMLLHEISMVNKINGFEPYTSWEESFNKFTDSAAHTSSNEINNTFECYELETYDEYQAYLLLQIVGTIDIELKSQIAHLDELEQSGVEINYKIEERVDKVINLSTHFKTRGMRYIFALNHISSSNLRDELLDVDKEHPQTIQSFTRWYNEVMTAISNENTDETQDALKKLYEMYKSAMDALI